MGDDAPGRVAILTNLRSLGWNFNPISLYFFYDGEHIVNAVAEVTNTPWLERHLYVLGPPGAVEFAKAHHVSPFLEMAGRYRLTYFKPNDRFRLSMKLFDLDPAAIDGLGAKRFSASMNFDRIWPYERRGGACGPPLPRHGISCLVSHLRPGRPVVRQRNKVRAPPQNQ